MNEFPLAHCFDDERWRGWLSLAEAEAADDVTRLRSIGRPCRTRQSWNQPSDERSFWTALPPLPTTLSHRLSLQDSKTIIILLIFSGRNERIIVKYY